MDTVQLVSLLSFAGIASGCGAILLGARDVLGRGRRESALKRELRRLPRIRDAEQDAPLEAFDAWLERTLYIANAKVTPIEAVLLLVLICLAVGGGIFLATANEIFVLLAVAAITTFTCGALVIVARRRLSQFESQFPMALDLLARAVRAGESFDQGLQLVGNSSEEPVRSELQRCARQLEMGLSLQNCMEGLAQRIDLMDVRIFANAIAVHRDSGGNLSITLERLAEVIRDRHSYHRQLKSITGAGRMSTLVITSLGPLLFVYMFFVQPDYGLKLAQDPTGQWMLALAVVLELAGIVWVLKMLKPSY